MSFFSQAGREDAILGTMFTILDHEEDHKNWLRSTPDPQLEDIRETGTRLIEQNITTFTQLITDLEKVQKGHRSLDAFLGVLLEGRLNSLRSRTNECVAAEAESARLPGAASPYCTIIPCDEELYTCNFQQTELNERMRVASLKRYQYLQLIIRRTWEVIEPGELSPRTLDLLSLSPHLWPLLKGTTYDLGSPDEAGGYAPLLYLRTYLRKGRKHLEVNVRACLGAAVFLYPREKEEKTQEAFDQFRATCDGELYKIYKQNTCQHTWRVRQLGGPWISTTALVPEAMIDPEKWPERKVPADLLVRQHPSMSPVALGPSIFSFSVPSQNEEGESKIPAAAAEGPAQEDDMPEPEASKIPAAAAEESAQEDDLPEAAEKGEEFQSAMVFDYPRGLRTGHSRLLEYECPIRKTPSSQLTFVQKLFNPDQCTNVTYEEFATFWRAIGGISEGGSHFHLFAPGGRPLWGSFRPHKSSAGYGSCAIRYLQAAVWWAGIRPQ